MAVFSDFGSEGKIQKNRSVLFFAFHHGFERGVNRFSIPKTDGGDTFWNFEVGSLCRARAGATVIFQTSTFVYKVATNQPIRPPKDRFRKALQFFGPTDSEPYFVGPRP